MRYRLIWLGLTPLLLGLPILLLSLGLVGGAQINRLIEGQLNSNLSSAQNFLNVVRVDLQSRIAELVKSEGIASHFQNPLLQHEVDEVLATTVRGTGFDFLLIVKTDGTVLGSSDGVARGTTVPSSFVIHQAMIGVANSGFEQFTLEELNALSPSITQRVFLSSQRASTHRVPGHDAPQEKGMLINAAAHFPLSVSHQDAVLVGGVFLNHNTALIEHLREIIYPTGSLPYLMEGFVGIFVGTNSIVNSRINRLGSSTATLQPFMVPRENTVGLVHDQFGLQIIGQRKFALGVSPIRDGGGSTIAALAVGFPISPFQNTAWLMLAIMAGLLGLIMLAISVIYLRAGNSIVDKIQRISEVMRRFRDGNRSALIQNIERTDELGMLAARVNDLLSTVAQQEQEQLTAQQIISDEASRRQAIFKNVRDGIVILDHNGAVFEVNAQLCSMLNYSDHELKAMRVQDWDRFFSDNQLSDHTQLGEQPSGLIQSIYRKKDGSEFPVEISTSRAEWSGRSFYVMLVRDITIRKEHEEKLKVSASVFTVAMEAIVLTDPHGVITDINHAYTQIMGYQKTEVVGKQATDVGLNLKDEAMLQDVKASLLTTGFWTGELTQKRKNGELFPALVRVSAVRNGQGDLQHFVAMFSDITLEKEQQQRLEHIALHDSLTSLANRQYLTERINHAMASSNRTGAYAAVLMLDLDNFKPLNDAYGHAAGDQLLIEVGKRLTSCVREVDTVARLGGDEFVVLLESLPYYQQTAEMLALQIAEKIRSAIDRPFVIKVTTDKDQIEIVHHCTTSIGVAVFLGKTFSQDRLLNMADTAMYMAKNEGKNHVHLYQSTGA